MQFPSTGTTTSTTTSTSTTTTTTTTPTTTSTTTTTTTTTSTNQLTSEGWQLSPSAGWSCNQVCMAVSLSCSEAEQHAHNADVSSSSGIQSIMNTMGKTCRGAYKQGVPGINRNGRCFASSPSRTTSEYNCNHNHNRVYLLCYCS